MLKRFFLLLPLVLPLWAQTPGPIPGTLQPLTLETYCKASIDRLQLVKSCLATVKKPPTALQLQTIWDKYRTTEKLYLSFATDNRKRVKQYLENNPEIAAKLDQLSAEIKTLIKQASDPDETE